MKKTVYTTIILLFFVAGALDVATTYLCIQPRTVFVETSYNTSDVEYTNGGIYIVEGVERNMFFTPFLTPVMFGVIVAVFNLRFFARLNSVFKYGVTLWFLVLSFTPVVNNLVMLMA